MSTEEIANALDNPGFQQLANSLLSNPGMVQGIAERLPHLQQLMDANPGVRELMSNPEAMRMILNPDTLRAMQQLSDSLQGGGGGGPMGDLSSMLGGPAAVRDPETTYARQLQQLQDMGFIDRDANVRALQATGGNVNAAVERLLSQL